MLGLEAGAFANPFLLRSQSAGFRAKGQLAAGCGDPASRAPRGMSGPMGMNW
jgi:hypothetical protein